MPISRFKTAGILALSLLLLLYLGYSAFILLRPAAPHPLPIPNPIANLPDPAPPSTALAVPPAFKLPYSISKETTVITSPLKPNGSPDYVAALNEIFGKGVTPENNGYAAFLRILGTESGQLAATTHDETLRLLGIQPTEPGAQTWQIFDAFARSILPPNQQAPAYDAYFDLHKHPWKPADNPLAADYLQKVGPLLDRAADAATLPHWWCPYVSLNGGMIEVLLPSLGAARDVTNAFAVRAALRAGTQDFPGFLADVIAIKRLARHQAAGGTLIEHLVGIAMAALADDTIGSVAGTGTLTQDQCAQLRKALAALPSLAPTSVSLDLERWSQLDTVQRIARGENIYQFLGDGPPSPLAGIQPDQVDWDIVLRRTNQQMDKFVASTRLASLTQLQDASKTVDQEIEKWKTDALNADPTRQPNESRDAYSERVARLFMAEFFPSLAKAEELHRRAIMQEAMLDTLLAAAAFHARTTQWPAQLADLLPADATAIPSDIYAEKSPDPAAPDAPLQSAPVRYRITTAGIRVYSLGSHKIDAGGVFDPATKANNIGLGVPMDPLPPPHP